MFNGLQPVLVLSTTKINLLKLTERFSRVFHACRLRQAVGPLLSRSQISHGQAEERRHFINGDLHTVLSYYFGCRLLGWKSIRA